MFPYVCIVALILFLNIDKLNGAEDVKDIPKKQLKKPKTAEYSSEKISSINKPRNLWILVFLAIYVSIQLFLPFSHFITKVLIFRFAKF